MGSRSALKLRNRGIAYKCNICGRKLMSPDALVAHERTAHNIISKRRDRSKAAPKSVKIKTDVKEDAQIISPVPSQPTETNDNAEMKKNLVEFECPKCFKRFPTYFPAHKHIQKYHYVNKQDLNVAPNHPSLIQPVRVELCFKCNLKVKSIQTHVCDGPPGDIMDRKQFVCTACEEWFTSLKAFDSHVLSLHADKVESMFFPTCLEFTRWKIDMEEQMKVSYHFLDKYDPKRYYHCKGTQQKLQNEDITYLCPSTIVVQEFSKGIQVHFYQKHYKHPHVEYKLTNKYKRFSITSFLNRSDDYDSLVHLKSDENDLYIQFKSLMEGIIVDAAKLNIATLKILIGKALELTSTLTNYDEEVEDNDMTSVHNESMSDAQIAKALEDPLTTNNKRKNNGEAIMSIVPNIKRSRLVTLEEQCRSVGSPKIVNSFSLAPDSAKKNHIVIKDKANEKTLPVKSVRSRKSVKKKNGEDTPPSFNDSYKDFVVKNFPITETTRPRSKQVVKTRIGQFKPSLSPGSKKATKISLSPETEITISTSDIKESTQEKYQTPKRRFKSNSKGTLKTKPMELDITPKPTTSNINPVLLKHRIDYQYEVREQEDDCNILIIKL